MSSHRSPAQQLEVDLRTIAVVNKILEKDTDPTLQSAKEELARIVGIFKDPSRVEVTQALRLLPDFMHSHPDLLRRVISENTKEIIERSQEALAFISSEIDYYKKIKQERPFTVEEKEFGSQLSHLLDSVEKSLS